MTKLVVRERKKYMLPWLVEKQAPQRISVYLISQELQTSKAFTRVLSSL